MSQPGAVTALLFFLYGMNIRITWILIGICLNLLD